VAPASPAEAQAAWVTLAESLPGRWGAERGDAVTVADYRLTARGTVLLETWMPGTPAETLTTYHLDGERLMLTHYCGQGNQASLRLVDAADGLSFSRFAVTNAAPEQGVLTELVLSPAGDQLERVEVYVSGEERESSTLLFTRLSPEPQAPGGKKRGAKG